MRHVLQAVSAVALTSLSLSIAAQTPAASPAPAAAAIQVPLEKLPYSPVLNVNNLDRSVNPCTDFYQFSCGGWMKNNPIPADQSSWSVYGKLGYDNQQFLWGILRDAAAMKDRNPNQQKIGDYFAACVDETAVDKRGDAPIQPVLTRIAGYKSREALLRDLPAFAADVDGSFFFNAGSTQDPEDSDKVIAEQSAGGLGLPDRDYYLKTDAKSVEIRQKYVAYIAQLLSMSGEPAAQAKADAEAVLKLETALATASLSRVDMRDPYKTFHKLTLADLQKQVPAVDWTEFFKRSGAPTFTTMNIQQPALNAALQTVLTTTSLPALQAYERFHALTNAAPAMSKPWQDAQFAFNSHYLRGTPTMAPRWRRCTAQVDRFLGEALGQEFVRRTFSADTKAKTLLMTKGIEDQMKLEIEQLDWMSPATKAEALKKLSTIRNKVGYPDTWRDYSALKIDRTDYFGDLHRANDFASRREFGKIGKPMDRNEWGMTPPTVNAYFDPQNNDINFPAGVLQPPLYDPKEDEAVNYGNTGSTIGHELTHGFDDEGRQFDAKGNLRDWWTKDDAKGFEDRINCVRDQFATYTVVDDIHINSKLTSGEDVADLGGTLIAYLAWRDATKLQRLAPVEGFTPDQRFFIGFAQWACENKRPEEQRVRAATDPHSPGEARINGIVTNLPQFATAFNCPKTAPMVKANVCKVW
ncbi:endothelin-converting enzyme [Terriglobus roseus DSM 18391]|uniref:Endothelin-converting enzyme n=1 Tax=Terriglobus roseus (strain DSM 18391 / NRRL B-41598 / KBS 63) TaxID=926566 RepID=I3ZLR2_TERRK|nr:M13 family metallopeptidase [Terriglobus roseus]AFL90180.1 endothelin-converting enzyme [Terriglobus roseus DSM 18391]